MKRLKSRPWLLLAPLLCLLALAAGPPLPLPDDTAAVQALLDGSAVTIRLEPRIYRVKTLRITRTLRLEGEGLATVLQFSPDSLGIQVNRTPAGVGDRCVIRSLCLRGGGGTDRTAHGIAFGAGRVLVEDVMVERFAGNGVEVQGANLWHLSRCALRYNGGHGLHLSGPDANVGCGVQLDLVGNGGWGVLEEGPTLGSLYLACHAAANGAGAYQIGGVNSAGVMVGCYAESGQKRPNRIGQRMVSLGGAHGSGWDTSGFPGSHMAADWLGLRLPRTQEVPLYGGPVVRAGSLPGATGARGDVMLNQYPSSGTPAGWSCTRSASGDAPAQWKAWGKIEP